MIRSLVVLGLVAISSCGTINDNQVNSRTSGTNSEQQSIDTLELVDSIVASGSLRPVTGKTPIMNLAVASTYLVLNGRLVYGPLQTVKSECQTDYYMSGNLGSLGDAVKVQFSLPTGRCQNIPSIMPVRYNAKMSIYREATQSIRQFIGNVAPPSLVPVK